jgi:hypothetical protein
MMKKRIFLLVFLIVLLVVSSAMVAGSFKVKANKENVVAGRLEGRWHPQIPLTKRLLGERYQPEPATSSSYISFSAEPSVVQKIPAKYKKFLKDKTIYMAGIMTRWGKDYPFILIELFGNPHIVYFREREGDPMGDTESFIVMLASAKDKPNDLLFIGGDFNNQPFAAYERKQKKSAAISPQVKPIADWLDSIKASNLQLFKSVYSEKMKAGLEKRGWDKVLKEYQDSCEKAFGDYDLADFGFSFEGDDKAGAVEITFKDKQLPPLSVTKENNKWKINER